MYAFVCTCVCISHMLHVCGEARGKCWVFCSIALLSNNFWDRDFHSTWSLSVGPWNLPVSVPPTPVLRLQMHHARLFHGCWNSNSGPLFLHDKHFSHLTISPKLIFISIRSLNLTLFWIMPPIRGKWPSLKPTQKSLWAQTAAKPWAGVLGISEDVPFWVLSFPLLHSPRVPLRKDLLKHDGSQANGALK